MQRRRTDRVDGSGRRKVQILDDLHHAPVWASLSPRARSVFNVLWGFAGHPEDDFEDGQVACRHCFPKVETIAELDGCSMDTVTRVLRRLREANLIYWITGPRFNNYVLLPPREVCEPIRQAIREDQAAAELPADPKPAGFKGSPDPSPDFSTDPEPTQPAAATARPDDPAPAEMQYELPQKCSTHRTSPWILSREPERKYQHHHQGPRTSPVRARAERGPDGGGGGVAFSIWDLEN